MTSGLDASAAHDDRQAAGDPGPADAGPADAGTAGGPRRRARAALLNASALAVTTAALAAFDAKLPRYVGD
jgi:hypothetical protein